MDRCRSRYATTERLSVLVYLDNHSKSEPSNSDLLTLAVDAAIFMALKDTDPDVGRKNWTFAGSDRGGQRAAALYTLIQTAKLNDIDPHAWLADVLARIAETPASQLGELLPWNWRPQALTIAA